MALFFFGLCDSGTLLQDDSEGEELRDIKMARRYAVESARQLLSEAALAGKAASLRQQIEVQDETGRTVLTIAVGHAADTDTQS